MLTENSNKYKQILVDIDNYNALKELGKTGDSFNDVVRILLNKSKREKEDLL
ncbi:MAG TPA: antitoxin VapB family protein [Candidatus Nitrosocosmicus sp.]|nr:antitoxin VapB family protein [Candidatus Nitrosocosmicus sp.]